MPLSEKSIKVNGQIVHYWEAGDADARPILLLHGGFGNAYLQWSEVMPLLEDEYRLIAPDLPAYGHSDALPKLTLPALIEWVRGLLAALDIDSAVVVGNSFGGLIGRLLAANHPAQVQTLILVNGGVIPQVPPLAKMLARLPLLGGILFSRISTSISKKSNLEGVLGDASIITPQFMTQIDANRGALGRIMRALSISPLPPKQDPAVPVILLWGEADTIAPVRVGEFIAKSITGAHLSVIEGCGHLPQLEAPEVFASQISLALRQLERGRFLGGAGELNDYNTK